MDLPIGPRCPKQCSWGEHGEGMTRLREDKYSSQFLHTEIKSEIYQGRPTYANQSINSLKAGVLDRQHLRCRSPEHREREQVKNSEGYQDVT